MEARTSVGGAGLAGPPRRPTDPPPPPAGARWVDEQLATRTGCGPVIVDRLVAHAIARFDPETHEDRENDATADSDVSLTHPEATDFAGTSHLEARGDTLTLKAFYDLICALAHQLFLDGDTDPLGARKIKAIGIITALATGQPTAASNAKSRSTSASTPTTSTSTPPAAPRSPPGKSRSSAPPP